MPESAFLADLDARDLIHDSTDRVELEKLFAAGTVTGYVGFDPTAASLHLGSLLQLVTLRRFQQAGNKPLCLVGSATGLIGDPSFRSDDRPMLSESQIAVNTAGIKAQCERFLEFGSGSTDAVMVDNIEWTAELGFLDFLRDVGVHVPMSSMLGKDSMQTRLARGGLTYSELSYMLIQAHDFRALNDRYGCRFQLSGSDQWGNVTAGIDLVRRSRQSAVHGLTTPLLTRADGQKFGKSAGGNVWLDPNLTSAYAMYQYLLGIPDADVASLLYRLTFLPVAEIAELVEEARGHEQSRTLQHTLAALVTELVHGAQSLLSAQAATELVFGDADRGAEHAKDPQAWAMLASALPTVVIDAPTVSQHELQLVNVMVAAGLGRSGGEVRRNLTGYTINGVPIGGDQLLHERDLRGLAGKQETRTAYAMLRRGKKTHAVLKVVGELQ